MKAFDSILRNVCKNPRLVSFFIGGLVEKSRSKLFSIFSGIDPNFNQMKKIFAEKKTETR